MPDLTFDQAYYNGGRDYGYTDYSRELLPFDWYANKLVTEMEQELGGSADGATILVLGCAFGYTVEFLVENHSADAHGMDVSQYAVDAASTETSHGGRVTQGDATVENDVKGAVKGKPDVVFTECLLSCLTDAEAQAACQNARSQAKDVVHRVWSSDGSDVNDRGSASWYNEKTLAEWRSLCDPDGVDYWYHDDDWRRTAGGGS